MVSAEIPLAVPFSGTQNPILCRVRVETKNGDCLSAPQIGLTGARGGQHTQKKPCPSVIHTKIVSRFIHSFETPTKPEWKAPRANDNKTVRHEQEPRANGAKTEQGSPLTWTTSAHRYVRHLIRNKKQRNERHRQRTHAHTHRSTDTHRAVET